MLRTRPSALVTAFLASLGGCVGTDGLTQPWVQGGPVTTSVTLTSSSLSFASIGDTHLLVATVRDQDGREIPGTQVTWTSSEPSVASVSSAGLVTARASGEATISAASGAASASASAVVGQVPASITTAPDFISLDGPGHSATVSVSVLDAGGSVIPDPDLTWSSGNEGVASVGDDGVVWAISSGSTTVTVSAGSEDLSRALPVSVGGVGVGTPSGGEVLLADGAVRLLIPAGVLEDPVSFTALPATNLPSAPAPIPGTAFELAPDGFVFGSPAALTIRYDPVDVPAGVPETELRLYGLVDGQYVLLSAGAVDLSNRTVAGAIDRFGAFAVLPRLRVPTSSLQSGQIGAPYSRGLTATGGDGSYTWSVAGGALPPGLSLAPSGVIAGAPTAAGTSAFTARVTSGTALSATANLTINVLAQPGPVALWSFEEGSGTTTRDGVGSNTGVLVNDPIWASGRINGGLFFDGVDHHVEVPDHGSLDISTDLTLSAWINPLSLGEGDQGRIVDKAGDDGTIGYVLRLSGAHGVGFQRHGQGGGVDSTPDVISLETWKHVVAVVSGGTDVTFYVDGVNAGGGTLAGPIAANEKPLRIGIRHDGSRSFEGSIDEVRVYDRALTQGEVASLYGEESSHPLPPLVPTVALAVDPLSIPPGGSATLTWSSTDAAACAAGGGWTGTKPTSGSEAVSPTAATTYALTCDGPGGSASETVTIAVAVPAPAPTLTFSAEPPAITVGDSSTLVWSSTDATACAAGGGWTGTKLTSGSKAVSPTAATTYVLTCDGPGGSASETVTVAVSPPTGPVAHWSFEEGSGAATADGAGSNVGTLSGGAVWSPGRIGGGVLLDGGGSYVAVADDASLDIEEALTLSAWIKPRSFGENGQGRIIDKASGDGTVGFVFRLDDSGGLGLQHNGQTVGVSSVPNVVTLNDWQHVVAVVSGGTSVALYVNGTSVGGGTLTGSIGANAKPLRIGIRHDGGRMFDGSLDEVRIYDRALAATEVAALYAEEAASPQPPQLPTLTLAASPAWIVLGESVTLTWNTTNAATCTAGDGWSGTKGLNGSEIVSPAATTTYALQCDGPVGSASESITVTVSTTYYPQPESNGGWRSLVTINGTPTPAEKADILARTGIDWDLLKAAEDYSESLAPSNVLVIRNGWIAGEWGSTAPQSVASVTKSLTGLAMAKLMDLSDAGQLAQSIGFQSLAYQYLPAAFGDSDPLKQQIRVEHLMTMSPGMQAADPDTLTLQERLTYPMGATPETEWVYSSLPPNLLSMILQDLSGQTLASFFNSRIASAIGASPLQWSSIDGGYTMGAAGASASARDLARIAYLTLRDGAWDDGSGPTQVVSPSRIAALTTAAPLLAGTTFRESPGSPFPVPADAPNHYGHLWWTNSTQVALGAAVPSDAYYMHGCLDDLVVVVPSENLIVVRTATSGPCSEPTFRSEFMQRVMAALTN